MSYRFSTAKEVKGKLLAILGIVAWGVMVLLGLALINVVIKALP